jgi:hypothetical protein
MGKKLIKKKFILVFLNGSLGFRVLALMVKNIT